MGANAAAEGFLRAYLRYSGDSTFHAVTGSKESTESFLQEFRQFAPAPATTPVRIYQRALNSVFSSVGCVFNDDPHLAHLAWQRCWEPETAYSLCGVTHTTCTQAIMTSFGQLVTAPFYAWDALICTSRSVRTTVDNVLGEWLAHLAERLGTVRRPPVELPIIPLGVECDRFDAVAANAQTRRSWRSSLGIEDGDLAFLFFGRLSYHAKANPFPMYRALEAAAQATQQKLHLILAGWFAHETLEQHFRDAAAQFCPSVKLSIVDGRRLDVRHEIWAAADIFTSLSDNIQETFGLTPVEAMAAGLPSVISDWDGYRDTVRHGIDGFRIPTSMAPAGTGEVFVRRHFNGVDDYDMYIGHSSHFTAVDIPQTTAAYIRLIEDPGLRRRFGESARQRAREIFDWKVIIGRYQDLWTELARRRTAAQSRPPRRSPHPLMTDPYTLFAEYATAPLNPGTLLEASADADEQMLQTVFQSPILRYPSHPGLMASLDEIRQILAAVRPEPRTVDSLAQLFAGERQTAIVRSLAWMLKAGLLVRQYPEISN